MKEITLKVLDGSDELIGTTLRLEKRQNSKNYICKKTGIEIIDKWEEINNIYKFSGNTKMKFDVLLFLDSENETPLFIKKVQQTSIKPKKSFSRKSIVSISKLLNIKTRKLAIG